MQILTNISKAELNYLTSQPTAKALIEKNKACAINIPKGDVKNSTGAGDSLVAGFIGKWDQTKDIQKAFQYGVASGSATAFNYDLAEKEHIEALLPQVEIQKL